MSSSLLPRDDTLRAVCEMLQAHPEPLYLVGGYIRDRLLQIESHDLDFAVDGPAIPLARRIADRFSGSFVLLDREHDAARAILDDGRACVDVARLRGADIVADLQARDFAMNAIALHVRDVARTPPPLIDPLRGQDDIAARLIRATSERAFRDDPLRLLRAVRQSATLAFAITPQTESWMRRDAHLIQGVASERVQDELVRLFRCPAMAAHVAALHALGLLPHILPELDPLPRLTLPTIAALEEMLSAVVDDTAPAAGRPGRQLMAALAPHRQMLASHLAQVLSADRDRRVLLRFAALLHELGEPQTMSAAANKRRLSPAAQALQRLRFSNLEVRIGAQIVAHQQQPLEMARQETLSPRDRYRFFRQHGDDGPDILCLSLAASQARGLPAQSPSLWAMLLETTSALLGYYHAEWPRVRATPRLLDGQDLIRALGLKPGPRLGRLLEALDEAQAVGEVATRDEALAWIRAHRQQVS